MLSTFTASTPKLKALETFSKLLGDDYFTVRFFSNAVQSVSLCLSQCTYNWHCK